MNELQAVSCGSFLPYPFSMKLYCFSKNFYLRIFHIKKQAGKFLLCCLNSMGVFSMGIIDFPKNFPPNFLALRLTQV